jgi:hypothetical protein
MKDLVIKGSVLKRELRIFLGCLCFAVILNIYSIIKYKTDWSELIGQLHIVILLSIFIYIVVFLILLAVKGIGKTFKK